MICHLQISNKAPALKEQANPTMGVEAGLDLSLKN